MKLWRAGLICVIVLGLMTSPAAAYNLDETVTSAVLMDPVSHQILFSHDPDVRVPPASITKIMTLALVCQAVADGKVRWDDKVVTGDYAASLGGSQIWLMPGEVMTLYELALAIAISSANDASAAAGEHIAGSHEQFVALMNEQARELGMSNTTFKNAHGLDDDGHVTTARDVAIMATWAVEVPFVLDLVSKWEEYLRDGATWLVNTNRLLRSAAGVDGLKTGSTSGAGFCVAVTARRDDMRLVSVIMGASDSQTRFDEASSLLNYGFANFETVRLLSRDQIVTSIQVSKGRQQIVSVVAADDLAVTVPRGEAGSDVEIDLPSQINAPVELDQVVGRAYVDIDGHITEVELKAATEVERARLWHLVARVFRAILASVR